MGLGVKVLLNRPRCCTDNGIVERGHGVLAQWVEAHKVAHWQCLQQALDGAILMQRERYPALEKQTRLQAFPDLRHNPRHFQASHEATLWQWHAVTEWLATRIWSRRVDKVGRISFFSAPYSVGRAYSGHDVLLRLDVQQHHWVIESQQGHTLKRYPCLEISQERIYAFALSKRANSSSSPPS